MVWCGGSDRVCSQTQFTRAGNQPRAARLLPRCHCTRWCASLSLVVQAFLVAMQSVVWVGVLLIMCVYIFAIMAQACFSFFPRCVLFVWGAPPPHHRPHACSGRSVCSHLNICSHLNKSVFPLSSGLLQGSGLSLQLGAPQHGLSIPG